MKFADVPFADLKPKWLMAPDENGVMKHAATLAEADGVFYLCPKCFRANGGNRGTHGILSWKPHVPAGITPGPGRWAMPGTDAHDISFVAGSSSILLPSPGGCQAHFFIRDGLVTDA
jgi:hypothetical protein